jgi:hypothetical protein
MSTVNIKAVGQVFFLIKENRAQPLFTKPMSSVLLLKWQSHEMYLFGDDRPGPIFKSLFADKMK